MLQILYKVLDDIAWQLEVEQLDYLFDRLRRIPLEEFLMTTVDLVKELSRFTYKAGIAAAIKALDLLFEVFADHNCHLVALELADYARKKAVETLCMFSVREQRLPFGRRCVQNIAAGLSVPHCARLLAGIIESFPNLPSATEPVTRANATRMLCWDVQTQKAWFGDEYCGPESKPPFAGALVCILLRELEVFSSSVIAQTASLALIPEQVDSHVFASHTPFIDSIRERLNLLRAVIAGIGIPNGPLLRLFVPQVDKLWCILYQQALTAAEQEECVRWLRAAAGSGPGSGLGGTGALGQEVGALLSETAVEYVFTQRMTVDLMPHYVTQAGFECALRYFLVVNSKAPATIGALSALTGEPLNKLQLLSPGMDRDDFVVHDFGTLIGFDYVWRVALEAINDSVVPLAIGFLNRLHECVSDEASLAAAASEV